MQKVRLRIGTKLGISAGIGILLVAGMIANDRVSKDAVNIVDAEAEAQKAVMLDAVATKGAVQGAQLAMHQARYGRSVKEIDRAIAGLDAQGVAGRAHIESALQQTADQESRGRLLKIQSRFADSLKAASEIASKQREVIRLEGQRLEITERWTKSVEEVLATAASFGGAQNDFERKIRAADSVFKDARLAALQFQITGDEVLMALILRAGDDATKLVKAAQELAHDEAARANIGALATTIENFRKTLEELVDVEENKLRIVRLRTNLIADEILGLIDKAVADATERSKDSDAKANAALNTASRVGVVVGFAVMAMLLGSALLSLFNIARPIRRIGDVLLELANGNKDVQIPFAHRTDEVGDTARAARTFQEQMVRMERLEAEQKEIEKRGADARKADMHQLADQFETAIGNIVEAVTRAASDLESAAGTLTGTAESTQELSGNVDRKSVV